MAQSTSEEISKKVLSGETLENCDLSGLDLSEGTFDGAMLSGSDLRMANLRSSSLDGANPVSYTHLTLPTKA